MAALQYTHDVGLRVIAVVCDQETSQLRLWREMDVSPQKPYIMHPNTGEQVFVMPDPVHLLKSVRNNLMNHPVQVRNLYLCVDFLKTAPPHVLRSYNQVLLLHIHGHSHFFHQTKSERAEWCHIKKLVSLENAGRFKIAWRLRPSDVNLSSCGKMAVKPAARVLSRSCAIGEFHLLFA